MTLKSKVLKHYLKQCQAFFKLCQDGHCQCMKICSLTINFNDLLWWGVVEHGSVFAPRPYYIIVFSQPVLIPINTVTLSHPLASHTNADGNL